MRSTFAILVAVTATGCMGPECSNYVIAEKTSPDGTMNLVLFSRNCGATTEWNTQAMLLAKDEKMPDEAGNIFILDHAGAQASWTKEGNILVTLVPGVRPFKQETSVCGIAIEYSIRSGS